MSAPTAARPLRVLAAPVVDPHPLGSPARTAPRQPAGQGVLPLRLSPLAGEVGHLDRFFGPQPTPSTALPDAEPLVACLARAVVEVLGGVRPAAQLVRWTTAEVHAGLVRRAALASRVSAARTAAPGPLRPGPGRPAGGRDGTGSPAARPRPLARGAAPTDPPAARAHRTVSVRRVVACQPRDGVVEAAVTVSDGKRVRALALRLEGLDGRWRMTALEVG